MLSRLYGISARGCGLVLFSLHEVMKLMMPANRLISKKDNNSRS